MVGSSNSNLAYKWKTKIAARNIDEAKSIIKKKKLNIKITHQDFDVLDTWFFRLPYGLFQL